MTQLDAVIARRRLLHMAGLGAAFAAVAHPRVAEAAETPVRVQPVPEQVRIAAVQSHAGADQGANLTAMLRRIDHVQANDPKDLIVFHALALHGRAPEHVDAARRMALGMDDAEVAALAAKAREHGVYLAFSALTTDADWPGRVIPRQILVGRNGRIVLAAWQAAHDSARPFLTSVEAELDRFVALYGQGAVLPVAATPIGNIAFASYHAAPDIDRALAMNGAELIVRLNEQASVKWDAQACAAYNRCTVIAPAAAANLHHDESVLRGGGSLIVGPRGEVLAEAGSRWDQTLVAVLPAAYNRATHSTLHTHAGLTRNAAAIA